MGIGSMFMGLLASIGGLLLWPFKAALSWGLYLAAPVWRIGDARACRDWHARSDCQLESQPPSIRALRSALDPHGPLGDRLRPVPMDPRVGPRARRSRNARHL